MLRCPILTLTNALCKPAQMWTLFANVPTRPSQTAPWWKKRNAPQLARLALQSHDMFPSKALLTAPLFQKKIVALRKSKFGMRNAIIVIIKSKKKLKKKNNCLRILSKNLK